MKSEVTVLWNQRVQSNRTICNSKLGNIIRDNGEETRMLLDVTVSEDMNVMTKETEKILKYEDLITELQRMSNVKNESDTSNNKDNWDHLKIIWRIPEQHTEKVWSKGTTEDIPTGTTHMLWKLLI